MFNRNAANVTLTDSMVTGNSTGAKAGGIFNYGNVSLELANTVISGNTASNTAGILANDRTGSVKINDSDISGNSSAYVGGVNVRGTYFTINRTTIKNNTGYGLKISSMTVTSDSLTVSGNTGTGISTSSTTMTLNNAMITNNSYGGIQSGGGNLDLNSATVSGNSASIGAGIRMRSGTMLDSLQDNGGPTFTLASLNGSPAIDTGDNAVDQRGEKPSTLPTHSSGSLAGIVCRVNTLHPCRGPTATR